MDKETKEQIKKLLSEEEYDQIFREFGQKAYKKYVPNKYKKNDLKKLKKEGKFFDIENKYGETEYKKSLVKAMYREIKDAKGTGAAVLWRVKQGTLNVAKKTGLYSLITSMALAGTISGLISADTKESIRENAEKYKEDIDKYNENIEKYAEEFSEKDLSDIQIFMKVMDDMWGNIKGYKNPEKNITGFLELDLADEEGYGVCRNMASDVAKKLNAIDPKYNARIITVKSNLDYKIADIDRNILETNETVADSNTTEQSTSGNIKLQKTLQNFMGDHMVTLVDVENAIMVLDPTNPGIGVYKDGRIIMLNSPINKDTGLAVSDPTEIATAIAVRGGLDGLGTTISDYDKSFEKLNFSFEELIAKYGLEAQNKALEEVREMYIVAEANEIVDQAIKQSELKAKYRVDETPKPSENNINTKINQENER